MVQYPVHVRGKVRIILCSSLSEQPEKLLSYHSFKMDYDGPNLNVPLNYTSFSDGIPGSQMLGFDKNDLY